MATIAEILEEWDITDSELKAFASLLQTDVSSLKRVLKLTYNQDEDSDHFDESDFYRLFLDLNGIYSSDNLLKDDEEAYAAWSSEERPKYLRRARSLFNKYNV